MIGGDIWTGHNLVVIKATNISHLTGIDVGDDLLLPLCSLGALFQEDNLWLHFGSFSTSRSKYSKK